MKLTKKKLKRTILELNTIQDIPSIHIEKKVHGKRFMIKKLWEVVDIYRKKYPDTQGVIAGLTKESRKVLEGLGCYDEFY